MINLTPRERIFAKVTLEGDCWRWLGTFDRDGYGRIGDAGRRLPAHRFAYTHLRGPIPEGMDLDHLCRNRACVNPDHLEPVTNHTNILRGISPSAENARKSECPEGHEYDGLNVRGDRICRRCIYEGNKRSRVARRARGLKA